MVSRDPLDQLRLQRRLLNVRIKMTAFKILLFRLKSLPVALFNLTFYSDENLTFERKSQSSKTGLCHLGDIICSTSSRDAHIWSESHFFL